MHIREARREDAEAACEVLRRSIVELCRDDHEDDAPTLQLWLANKTPDHVLRWIGNAGTHMLVAEEAGAILGVASLQAATGIVLLNYVSPDARFRGVSRALMAHVEAKARELGLGALRLDSTGTARRFYRAMGFSDAGPPAPGFGRSKRHPMRKELAPTA